MAKTPDFRGFIEHIKKWEENEIPWGISDLVRLAKKYSTPVPESINIEEGKISWSEEELQ